MSKTKTQPRFGKGDLVRVKSGVADPDFADIPIGGWAGRISEVAFDESWNYLILLNAQTLKSIHPIFRKRCERDGLEFDRIWMSEDDLEPDMGQPAPIEQPTNIVSRPLSMDNKDDRIRSIFGLTSDDLLPETHDEEAVLAYYEYLAANLSFPFEAHCSIDTGPFSSRTHSITVIGLLDPDEFLGEEFGIAFQALRGEDSIEIPLTEVEIRRGHPNQRLVEDYSYWFVNF